MDAFEAIVKLLLERRGYWVQPNFKVELTREEKRAIGKHSHPAVDLDLLAYRASVNEVFVVECKSFLDSPGVRSDSFLKDQDKDAKRYKLFVQGSYRAAVMARLTAQLIETGRCRPQPKIHLCLATGKIANEKSRDELHRHFAHQGWTLWDDKWIRAQMREAAASSYENQIPLVVAKLLLRGQISEGNRDGRAADL